MEPVDILLGMAEIAIAILGFGGVVAAFAGAPEPGGEQLYATRLAGLLASALNALVLSLVPLYFASGGGAVPWGALSAFQALELFSFGGYFVYAWYKNPYGSAILGVVGIVGSGSLGWFQLQNFLYAGTFQTYFAGLIWQTLLPALLFARMAQVILTAGRPDAKLVDPD